MSEIEVRRENARRERAKNPESRVADPDVLENWYSQDEIRGIVERSEYEENVGNMERVEGVVGE